MIIDFITIVIYTADFKCFSIPCAQILFSMYRYEQVGRWKDITLKDTYPIGPILFVIYWHEQVGRWQDITLKDTYPIDPILYVI